MARVPRAGHVPTVQREVETQPLPGARLTAAQTETSLGVGVEEAKIRKAAAMGQFSETIGHLGGAVFNIAMQERQRADEIALLDADNQLSTTATTLLYDPETGALNQRGKNAMGMPERAVAAFEDAADKIEDGLSNERQKRAFRQARVKQLANFDLTVRRHTAGEIQRYEGQELQAFIENKKATAIANGNDPRRVGDELAAAGRAIRVHGPRLGLGPEQVEQQLDALANEVHAGVIDGLLTGDQTRAAEVYFEEVKDQLSGPTITRIEKALAEGTLRRNAQVETDRIVGQGGTLTEQRNRAKAIDEPRLRDAVLERIEHEAAVQEREQREQHELMVTNGKNLIDQTGDWHTIPPGDWSRFSIGEAAALKAYAEHRVAQRDIKTDPHAYQQLVVLSGAPERALRDQFLKTNLLEYVDKLSPADLKHFQDAQANLRRGEVEKAEKLLVDDRAQARMVDDALISMGFDPTPPQPGQKKFNKLAAERVADFRRAVREAVTREAQRLGRPARDDEVQSIVDQLRVPTVQRVTEDGWFWDTKVQAFAFETAQAQITDVKLIPPNERRKIENDLRASKLPVNDASVLAAFNLGLARTRKDFTEAVAPSAVGLTAGGRLAVRERKF